MKRFLLQNLWAVKLLFFGGIALVIIGVLTGSFILMFIAVPLALMTLRGWQ